MHVHVHGGTSDPAESIKCTVKHPDFRTSKVLLANQMYVLREAATSSPQVSGHDLAVGILGTTE